MYWRNEWGRHKAERGGGARRFETRNSGPMYRYPIVRRRQFLSDVHPAPPFRLGIFCEGEALAMFLIAHAGPRPAERCSSLSSVTQSCVSRTFDPTRELPREKTSPTRFPLNLWKTRANMCASNEQCEAMMRMVRLGLLCLGWVLLSLTGCWSPRTITRFELTEKPSGLPITRKVMLVGDNQIHHLHGDHVPLQTVAADKVVGSAIRPVALNVFGSEILSRALEAQSSTSTPVIHMGDGLDLACGIEFEKFLKAMEQASAGWVMVPGNHDFFYYGNAHRSNELHSWQRACERGGGPVDKQRFIRGYLDALTSDSYPARHRPEIASLASAWKAWSSAHPVQKDGPAESGEWRFPQLGEDVFLRAVYWRIDPSHPYRSFIVQEVNLSLPGSKSSAVAILLDTNHYRTRPFFAGTLGLIRDEQIAVVKRWLQATEIRPGKGLITLVGHHSYKEMQPGVHRKLAEIQSEFGATLFVSAHTHEGHIAVHKGNADMPGWLELNVGSLIDWPLEYRTLQFALDGSGRTAMVSELHRLTSLEGELRPVFERCAANPAWRPTRKEFNELRGAYTARSVKAWDDLVHGALQVYRRLFLSIPLLSDAPPAQTAQQATLMAEIDVVLKHDSDKLKRHAPDLLRKLADFEPERKVSQDDLRAYKLCNAWWSSLFDAPTRSPGGDPFAFPVEHPYVLLP